VTERFIPGPRFSLKVTRTYTEIRQAAAGLDFPAILPGVLPDGTKPIRLFTAGTSLLAITYDLPGIQRRSHHMLSIFIANHNTMAALNASTIAGRYNLRFGLGDNVELWRMGPEEVIVVSNGLTESEFAAIKSAMQQQARDSVR
jgi:hypothetical protein